MRLDQTILNLSITALAVFGAWVFLIVCVRLAKKTRQHYELQQLRRDGRTVPNEHLNSEAGVVLCVEATSPQSSVEYWWVPTSTPLSSEEVVEKWMAGEALAFDQQKEIGRMVFANLIPRQVVRYREVSRFNTS
jgi:hypothetical protein